MNNVRVGVGVIIKKQNQILLGYRINSHGEGSWAPSGGHLEYGETPEECAVREVIEETGIEISDIKRGPWTNDYFPAENKHYITIYILANHYSGTPKLLEPHKCKQWQWFDMDDLPENLFLPIKNLLQEYGNIQNLLEIYG